METTNYFLSLEKIQCEVEKKNGLNYISWSDGWAELKRVYPEATYRKVKNGETYLFKSGTGGSVECEVTVGNITHCADLAVTDIRNQEIKYDMIKSTDIQNTLQRAFAKAIAMHGIGLYVYRGEDFPEDENEEKKTTTTTTKPYAKQQDEFGLDLDDYIASIAMEKDSESLKLLYTRGLKLCISEKQKDFFTSLKDKQKKVLGL